MDHVSRDPGANLPASQPDTSALRFNQPHLLLKVSEVADELRIARSYAYRLVQEGQLPVVRIGRSVRVPREALEEWVHERTQQSQ